MEHTIQLSAKVFIDAVNPKAPKNKRLVMYKGIGTLKGTWVRVQWVRVEVGMLYPRPNPDPHHGLGLPA